MYQFGLSPGSATAEVPRMSFALGANRWASKVVVVLQLAAWTAVGIVLLQKGVASLQKNSAANAAAVNSSLVSKPIYNETASDLRVVDDFEEEMEFSEEDRTEEDENSTTTEKPATVFEVPVRRPGSPSTHNNSGGGTAAAAVAMVAVGAVMLVLGPAVIILRALDERRQERRFLKLSGQDDLPPSYEQATLMDEAPRYSTLSLNTINCSTIAIHANPISDDAGSSTVAIINNIDEQTDAPNNEA